MQSVLVIQGQVAKDIGSKLSSWTDLHPGPGITGSLPKEDRAKTLADLWPPIPRFGDMGQTQVVQRSRLAQ